MKSDHSEQASFLRKSVRHMEPESILKMAYNLKLLIIIIDQELKLKFGNDIFFDLVGFPRDKVLDKDYVQCFIPANSKLVVRNTLLNIMNKDTDSYSGTNKIITSHRGTRYITWNSIHLHSDDGEITGMLCMGIDVTETHSLNNVLSRANWEKTIILDQINEMVVYYDSAGRITWVNQALLDRLESGLNSVIGSYIHDIVKMDPPDSQDFMGIKVHSGMKNRLNECQNQFVPVTLFDQSKCNSLVFYLEGDSLHTPQFIMIMYPESINVQNNKANQYNSIIINQGAGKNHDPVGIFSPKMKKIMQQAEILHKDRSVPVLIEGETGTGKEVIARYIHFGNKMAAGPFVDINCAALTATIFESELFGYEGGAFTGSRSRGQKGKIAIAQGGTLFLDEIGEIPTSIQAKLLRVIQEKEYFPVGGVAKMPADVRWICATNSDLYKRVQEGTFREDLYYRLEVFHLYLPPLRERPEDIIPLANMFLQRLTIQKNKHFRKISKEASNMLVNYSWPGNVRQLQNFIERIVLVYDDTEIRPEHLDFMHDKNMPRTSLFQEKSLELPAENLNLQELNRKIIDQALQMHDGNITKTAAYLGISRRALSYRLKQQSPPKSP